uniref:WD_REPEATS_REGION domain-containing protein n=1 Tax=Glossina pallidipes TaxID=7398 RepID=A0A1A9ZBL8_GLOPL
MDFERNADPYLEGYFLGHTKPVTQVRFSPDGSTIATSSADSTVMLWNLTQPTRCLCFSEHANCVNGISWSPNTNLIASCSQDGIVNVWEPKEYCICQPLLLNDKPLRSVDFHPIDPVTMVMASDDKSVKLWRIDQKKIITSFATHGGFVRSAKFSPNGQLVASCGDDKSLRIFDMKSGECVWCRTEERGMGRQLAWHPSGNIVAVALSCCHVKVFDLVAQEIVQYYRVHSAPVNDLAFHPSGNFLLTASDDETVKILNLLEGRSMYTFTGHMGGATAVAFNNDGSRFASADCDRRLFVWKTQSLLDDLLNREQSSAELDDEDVGFKGIITTRRCL